MTDLFTLTGLLADPDPLRRWLAYRNVLDVQGFIDLRAPDAVLAVGRPWGNLQSATRSAKVHADAGNVYTATRLLTHLLDHYGFIARTPAAERRIAALALSWAPDTRPTTAREVLRKLGGIAGARAIADRLTETTGAPVSIRQVRDRLRNTNGVEKWGGGYYVLEGVETVTVRQIARWFVDVNGHDVLSELVAAILLTYPHGDERAVKAWLCQPASGLVVRDGWVSLRDAGSTP